MKIIDKIQQNKIIGKSSDLKEKSVGKRIENGCWECIWRMEGGVRITVEGEVRKKRVEGEVGVLT